MTGFANLMRNAKIPPLAAAQLLQDVGAEGLGAVDVNELTREDWESLPSWGALRPLQQRRLLESGAAGTGGGAP